MTAEQPWLDHYPDGIQWQAAIAPATLLDTFAESVSKFGDKVFLNFYGSKMTYAEFGARAQAFAAGLQAQGVGRDTKVGLCLPNTPFYPVAYYGTLLAGGIVVNINPLWAEKVAGYIKDSGMEVMVTTNLGLLYPHIEKELGPTTMKKIIVCDFLSVMPLKKKIGIRVVNFLRGGLSCPRLTKLIGEARREKILKKLAKTGAPEISTPRSDAGIACFDKLCNAAHPLRPVHIRPEDVAVFQYTGGTTGGEPKAAVLTHANLTANIAQANMWFNSGKNNPAHEKQLVILPFSHVFAMTVQMNMSFSRGAEVVMLPKFELQEMLDTVTAEKPTMFAGVPTIYKMLVDHKSIDKYDLSSVTIWLCGAMALPKPTAEAFHKLTGLDIIEGYGLSETSPLAAANPIDGAKKSGSIGLPVPMTEIRIINRDDAAGTALPVGETGGIHIRGPQVMREYWNNPAKTAEAMRADGFFYTGDDGHMDAEGYFFITGRSKEMSIVNGNKVYWENVEKAALQHPDISEALVIGIEDKDGKGADKVKIFLVMKPGKTITQGELSEFLKHRLASYEVPRALAFRDSFPKTPVGKYDKKALMAEDAKAAQ